MSETAVTVRYVLDTDTVTHQQLGHSLVIAKLRLVERSTNESHWLDNYGN